MTSPDMSPGIDPEYAELYRRLRAEGGYELREQLHTRYLDLERGGTTPLGLPYPDPTDPVAEGADAIRALAEATSAHIDRISESVDVGGSVVAETGWGVYYNHDGGTPAGTPSVQVTGNLAAVRMTLVNETGSSVTGTPNVLRGLPRCSLQYFALQVVEARGVFPGAPMPGVGSAVSLAGTFRLITAIGTSIAAGQMFEVVGFYPVESGWAQLASMPLSLDDADLAFEHESGNEEGVGDE